MSTEPKVLRSPWLIIALSFVLLSVLNVISDLVEQKFYLVALSTAAAICWALVAYFVAHWDTLRRSARLVVPAVVLVVLTSALIFWPA
jgi:hypothetical protein